MMPINLWTHTEETPPIVRLSLSLLWGRLRNENYRMLRLFSCRGNPIYRTKQTTF